MLRIIPSIASADPLALGQEIARLGNHPYLHVDIEDGTFMPNITFGLKAVQGIAKVSKAELDVHMMVSNPGDFIGELAALGVKQACAQIEALHFPSRFIEAVRNAGMIPGLALCMKTDISVLEPYKDKIGYVLILSSEPDGIEAFNPFALEKLGRARALLPASVSLWIDGGVTRDLIGPVLVHGADTVIMGRAVWGAEDPVAAIAEMQELKP